MRSVIIIALAAALSAGASLAQTRPDYYTPLNPVYAGFGPDAYTGLTPPWQHHPMAYGLFASSFAHDGLLDEARQAADWLIKNKDIDKDGVTGWGLPFAYDAFSDGSINPADTSYNITTVEVVQGLLDVYEATQEQMYLDVAIEGLEAVALGYRGGGLHYSQRVSDAIRVHNVAGMALNVYARAAAITGRADFQRLADRLYDGLMTRAVTDGSSYWWDYSIETGKRNDIVHAAYIVIGLKAYGAPASVVEKAMVHMRKFVRNGTVYETTDPAETVLARVWGVGAALFLACQVGDATMEMSLRSALPLYRVNGDIYTIRPGDGFYAPRMQAHITWGLSYCNAS